MKIAEISRGFNPKEGGGVGKHITLFNIELKKIHDIDIYTTNDGMKKSVGNITVLKTICSVTPSLFFRLLSKKYDLYHVHGYQTFEPIITIMASWFTKTPILFTPHYHPFGKKPKLLRKIFDRTIGHIVFHNVNRIICITDYEKKLIENNFKIKSDKITLIYNPIDPDFLKIQKNKTTQIFIKKRFKIKPGINLLYVGSLSSHKGLSRLVSAVTQSQINFPQINLLIVGAGTREETNNLKRIIDENKCKNTHVTGPITKEQLISFYDIADIFVLPSDYEAFGFVLIEAMARNCLVVASNVGGIPFVLEDGKSGILVEKDAKNISAILSDIIVHKSNYNKIKARGRARAKQFDLVKLSQKLNIVIKSFEK